MESKSCWRRHPVNGIKELLAASSGQWNQRVVGGVIRSIDSKSCWRRHPVNRIKELLAASSGSIRRRRNRTWVCMMDGGWSTMAALLSGRFMRELNALPTGLLDVASAALFFMPRTCVMRSDSAGSSP